MSKNKIKDNIEIFKCPICSNKMEIYNMKSLICSRNHCFDLSKNGYLNFLLSSNRAEYDKLMFKSRNIMCKNGFFEPLVELISEIIVKQIGSNVFNKVIILDVGCGEGSHLNQIIGKLQKKTGINFEGVGIDISKEGIQVASKAYPDHVWCVGDLARSPFMDKKFDVILNILSPSNYSEFNRIISNNGILIKVVPGNNYLKELRKLFYYKTSKESYSNEKVLNHFNNSFPLIDKEQLQYTVALDRADLENLIKMTPLSWSATQEKVESVLSIGIDKITVEFTIIYGKKDCKKLYNGKGCSI